MKHHLNQTGPEPSTTDKHADACQSGKNSVSCAHSGRSPRQYTRPSGSPTGRATERAPHRDLTVPAGRIAIAKDRRRHATRNGDRTSAPGDARGNISMKSSIRTVLLTSLMTLTLSGITTASASAFTECKNSPKGVVVLCVVTNGIAEEQLGETAFTAQQKPGTTKRFSSIAWGGGEVNCSGETATGTFDGTASKLEITHMIMTYSSCSLGTPEHCTVSSPLIIDGAEGTGSGPGINAPVPSPSEIHFEGAPGSGHDFTVVHIQNSGGSCLAKGNWSVHGSDYCELQEATKEEITHVLHCSNESGDGLTTEGGSKVESIYTDEVKLSTGKAWKLYKG